MSLRTIASVRNCMKTCMSTMAAQDSERNILAAVIQMTSTADKRANLTRASSHVKKAASMGAKLAFLPEGFDFIGDTKNAARELAEPIDGPTVAAYRELARKHGIALSLGGLHEAVPGEVDGGKIRNTHVLIDGSGEILSTYSKAHLFDVEIPGKFKLRESDWTTAGDEMKPPEAVPTAGGLRVGLGICYDLRFPEMAQYLARRGADVITYPSAFTVATGLAHWESLLRARAIETQCYVVAAAQTGKHNEKRSTFGHSVIIDPWGTVVAQCGEGEGVAFAEIDRSYLSSVRQNMPVERHRRTDLYGIGVACDIEPINESVSFQFGKSATIHSSCLVFQTRLSIVSVNKKPVVPGHLLVIPKRTEAARMKDLSAEEVCDLFLAARLALEVAEEHFEATASTMSVQDGREAGQTVEHVHVHVLPRKAGDFAENDDVYTALATHDRQDGGWRSEEEMVQEAVVIRKTLDKLKRKTRVT